MLTSSRPRLRASLLKTSFLPLLLPQKTQILRNRFEGATLPITDVSSFSDGFRVADCIPTSVSWMVMSRLPMLVLQLLPGTASKTPAAKNSEVFCADMHTKPRHLSLSQKAKKLNVWTGSLQKHRHIHWLTYVTRKYCHSCIHWGQILYGKLLANWLTSPCRARFEGPKNQGLACTPEEREMRNERKPRWVEELMIRARNYRSLQGQQFPLQLQKAMTFGRLCRISLQWRSF